MTIGIDGKAVEAPVLVGDGPAKTRCSPGDRVLVGVTVEGAMRRLDHRRRRREVWHPLRQVDASVLVTHPGHLADDGLREPLQHPRNPRGHHHRPWQDTVEATSTWRRSWGRARGKVRGGGGRGGARASGGRRGPGPEEKRGGPAGRGGGGRSAPPPPPPSRPGPPPHA